MARILLGLAWGIALWTSSDWALGWWRDTALIREQARMFREEVAVLGIPTLNLVPNLVHNYQDEPRADRPNGERLLRTGREATILGPTLSQPDETRILFLGGSTTECNEVDEEFRFPAVVERLLREGGHQVVALNAGVRGHTSEDSINALLNRPGFRDAEIVVLMHNINDRLRLSWHGNYAVPLGDSSPTTWRAVHESAIGLAQATWDFVTYRSNALFMLRSLVRPFDAWSGQIQVNGVDAEGGGKYGEDAEPPAKLISLFKSNLEIAVSIVRILGHSPVLMTQPLGVKSRSQDSFNDAIRQVARRLDVVLVDLATDLGQQNQWAFLADQIHFNNHGSEAAGRTIAAALEPLVGGPSRSP